MSGGGVFTSSMVSKWMVSGGPVGLEGSPSFDVGLV